LILSGLILPLLLGVIGAISVYFYGSEVGLIDMPNERSSHITPTPRGGGLGIWISGILASIFFWGNSLFTALGICVGLMGFIEDRFSLSAKVRLILQFVVFSVTVYFFCVQEMPFMTSVLVLLFWLLFITWTSNLYNFMDGIDGIAGINGVVTFGLTAWYFYNVSGNISLSLISLSLAAACLGFLFMNFPKAKVFMGDVGSTFLGFVFGFLVMMGSRSFIDFLCLVSFLFMFYADEAVSMFFRIKEGKNLLKAHRSHFYQILANEKEIAHWKVSTSYGIAQLLIGFCTIFLRSFGSFPLIAFMLIFFMGFGCIYVHIRGQGLYF
jgi:Fuc2NAc and GlcNAc transferase